MNPNKLTTKAQEALQAVQAIAQERGQQALEPEHLLLALLDQKEGAGVMQLVIRVGHRGDDHSGFVVGGMDKFVASRINSDVRNSMPVGILEENEIPGT